MKKLTLDHLEEITRKYSLEFELKITNKGIRILISDFDETKVIKYDRDVITSIDLACRYFKSKEIEKMKSINNRLKNLDPNLFPDDLFEKE